MEEYNRRLIEEFRAGRLEPGGPLEGRPMLLLTTTGAKTGRRHTMPLMYVLDGGRLLVIASNAGAPRHPDWYRNLSADPGVTVEFGAETYEATAAELEGEERERVWGDRGVVPLLCGARGEGGSPPNSGGRPGTARGLRIKNPSPQGPLTGARDAAVERLVPASKVHMRLRAGRGVV
jgi:deazaflavin-dependent oxidoreductase (nitroreductase family)